MTRSERQAECVAKWKASNGKGTIQAATGFGKTRIGTIILNGFKAVDAKAIIVVPSLYLKEQWESKTDYEVVVINTAIKTKKKCHLLILDECHRFAAEEFSKVFEMIEYTYILGLTATFERHDMKHEFLTKKIPVVDVVSVKECLENGWVSKFKYYEVLIDVNLKPYEVINRQYHKFFSVFNHNFDLAMSMLDRKRGADNINRYALELGWNPKEVKANAANFMRMMQRRKQWIHEHPKKMEVCLEILEARQDSKAITFSQFNSQADALADCVGKAYHSGMKDSLAKENMDNFIASKSGVIHTASKVNEGADIPGLNLGIVVSGDSSLTKDTQRLGRVIREEEGKIAEFFSLVLVGTQDTVWTKKRIGVDAIQIEYDELKYILRG